MNMKSETPSIDPTQLFAQAISLQRAGRHSEAASVLRQLLALYPTNVRLLNTLGATELATANVTEAIQLFARSLELRPDQPSIWFDHGRALISLGRLEEALASFDRAIALDPSHVSAHNNRGAVLQALQRLDDALDSYTRAIELSPDYADAHNNRGTVLQKLERFAEALASYDRAIALKSECAQAHSNRGSVLGEMDRWGEALASCDRAIALNPGYADAYINRGDILLHLKRFREALASYDHAVALRPTAEAYSHRSGALKALHRHREALASCDRAIALRPDFAEAYNNRALVLEDAGRLDEALADLDRAIALKPDYAWAHWNKALLKLLRGDYAEGWRLYEWRWKGPRKDSIRRFSQPSWLGDRSIAGKTLLIHAEQGLGDTIQFCRYVPMVEALGAHVVLEVPSPLVSLISTLKGRFRLVEQGGPLPAFDLHCPIMSLPLAFKTQVETIPSTTPYLFADEARVHAWRDRLGPRARPRVGLVWSGTRDHKNDHNRSIPLRLLAPLCELPIEFHALQKEIGPEDKAVLANFESLRSYDADLHDFADTAALVHEIDLVISVDTSVAHLAGAMGKPVWILLPSAPDFRWMLDRSDSPWYPTATLIRQPAPGGWSTVISEVARRLARFIAEQQNIG
jgi:tetratricopeptide (TPR) repeat protein